MNARIKLWELDGQSKRGFPVKLILTYNSKRRRKIIAHSSLGDWDPAKELPKRSHPDFENLYSRIIIMRSKAITHEFEQISNFKKAFDFLLEKTPTPVEIDFYSYSSPFLLLKNNF